jgi:acyl transferase domain-containing protein
MRALTVNTDVPLARWATPTQDAKPSAAYGSFMTSDQLSLDHGAFGISLAEARSMDPQQGLVLGVGYSVLRRGSDFSSSRSSFTNSNTGVFVGVEPSGLAKNEASVFSASGGALSVTAGRLSFSLGLVGPCYSIDAACASSLAALHACVVTLQNGQECEDGVTIGTKVLSEAVNYATSVAGMTSVRGRCHTFDQRADGYCRGEGCGAFYVRSNASSGVKVLGSAVQQDGPSASLTAPNGSSQRRLIESVSRTITDKNGNPSLEAHGTGTALGDPIEVCYYLSSI